MKAQKWLGCLGLLLVVSTVNAGQVVVRKSSEPFDAFAVRDEVQKQHQWQEVLRYQQHIQILQSLPFGCITIAAPYRYFSCQGLYYRPYNHQNKDVFIQIDDPKAVGNE